MIDTASAPSMTFPRKLRYIAARAWQEIAGLAQDYWKDGGADGKRPQKPKPIAEKQPPAHKTDANTVGFSLHDDNHHGEDSYKTADSGEKLWHALAGEISEKMWGRLCVTPGDGWITDALIQPLSLNKEMSVLDISAGLGGRLRKTVNQLGVHITGMEPDAEVATRGMQLLTAAGQAKHIVINHYDPMKLTDTGRYDCVISRETIYRVEDKQKFVGLIAELCKPSAQASFTDYIVDPEFRSKEAILGWQAFEWGARPPSLVEMAEMWAKHQFKMSVHEDQTDYYKKEILMGLQRLAKFLASGVKPDAETKKAIDKRIATWAHRMNALEAGMKFYRFYATR